MSDFVTPEPWTLTLHDGKVVVIQKELNHGDSEDLNERIWPGGGFSRRMVRTARICAYLLSWSLTKPDPLTKAELPVPYSLDLPEETRFATVRGLSQPRAVEIFNAIEAHEAAMAKARAEQKKILGGGPADVRTSPSPSAPAGASNGSAPSAETITLTSSTS